MVPNKEYCTSLETLIKALCKRMPKEDVRGPVLDLKGETREFGDKKVSTVWFTDDDLQKFKSRFTEKGDKNG